jgi:SAM-dependent methyltransferase
MKEPPDVGYWDHVIAEQGDDHTCHPLWRSHSDNMNLRLIDSWLEARPAPARILKTDLFDEAVGNGLYPNLIGHGQEVVCIDVSPGVCASARNRHRSLTACAADVRSLPFREGTFDLIVSNSTLDHFPAKSDIARSLEQLTRVLRTGGMLIITFDNPCNPLIWTRNHLPFRHLKHWGLVPYFVGLTYGPAELQAALRGVGLTVLQTTAILHCPRLLAIPLSRLVSGLSVRRQVRFLWLLRQFERLEKSPLRYLTGHFVAAAAVKPEPFSDLPDWKKEAGGKPASMARSSVCQPPARRTTSCSVR